MSVAELPPAAAPGAQERVLLLSSATHTLLEEDVRGLIDEGVLV